MMDCKRPLTVELMLGKRARRRKDSENGGTRAEKRRNQSEGRSSGTCSGTTKNKILKVLSKPFISSGTMFYPVNALKSRSEETVAILIIMPFVDFGFLPKTVLRGTGKYRYYVTKALTMMEDSFQRLILKYC